MEWLNDHPYTCPILMYGQSWLKWQKWHYGCDGWVVLQSVKARATCMWPDWLVMTEYQFWNSWMGCWVRKWCGTQQREYRLRQQQE